MFFSTASLQSISKCLMETWSDYETWFLLNTQKRETNILLIMLSKSENHREMFLKSLSGISVIRFSNYVWEMKIHSSENEGKAEEHPSPTLIFSSFSNLFVEREKNKFSQLNKIWLIQRNSLRYLFLNNQHHHWKDVWSKLSINLS